MKHIGLILNLILVTLLIGCTNIDELPYVERLNEKANNVSEATVPGELDPATRKLVSFFRSNLDSISQWQNEWEIISQAGAIPVDSIKVLRGDSCQWYYVLPVVKQDSLVGVVAAMILEDEIAKGGTFQIRLKAESKVALPKLILPKDTLFYSLSNNFGVYKRKHYTPKNTQTRIISSKINFPYKYTLDYRVSVGDEIVVTGGNPGVITYAIEYFRFVGYPVEIKHIGGGYLILQFGFDEDSGVVGEAYDFAGALNTWLDNNGYLARIEPLFLPDGISNVGGGSSGSGGGTGGGSSTGSGGSSAVIVSGNITKIFGRNFNLTQDQVNKLVDLYDLYVGGKIGLKCQSILLSKNIKIDFRMNSSWKTPASFLSSTNEIVFKNTSSINGSSAFNEEMTHALQYHGYYGDAMTSTIINYDFEVKLLGDIACSSGEVYGCGEVIPLGMDDHPEYLQYTSDYSNFIQDMKMRGWNDATDYNTYYDLCQGWHEFQKKYVPGTSYSAATFDPNLSPKALIDIYKKQ